MEKEKALEFLQSIIGETIYVINESNRYDDNEYEVVLSLPDVFTDELYEIMEQTIIQDKIEFTSWRYTQLPEEEVYILYIKKCKRGRR